MKASRLIRCALITGRLLFVVLLLIISCPLFPGIPELEKLGLATHCKRNVLDECERGSVTMDTWVNQTLSFQRALSGDTPLNLVQLLASHNSFNNKADG